MANLINLKNTVFFIIVMHNIIIGITKMVRVTELVLVPLLLVALVLLAPFLFPKTTQRDLNETLNMKILTNKVAFSGTG